MAHHKLVLATLALVADLVGAGGVLAIERCAARVNQKTGAVEVNASGLVGLVSWSGSPSQRTVPFADGDRCIVDGRARRCTLGAPGTLAAITPPGECRVCIDDDASAPCCAFVKGCTPGPRLRDASFAAGDPRVCQGLGAADPSCGPVGIWERVDGLVRLGYVSVPDLLVLDPDGKATLNSRELGGTLRCTRGVHTKGSGNELVLDPERAGVRVLRFRLPDADTLVLADGGDSEATYVRHDVAPAALRCGSFEVLARLEGLPLPDGLGGLAFDGTSLWYSDQAEQEIAVNPTTGATSPAVDLPGVVLAAEGQTLWMRDDGRTSVSRVAQNGAVLDAVPMPGSPALIAIGLAPDVARGTVFVSTTSQDGATHPLLTMQTSVEPDAVLAEPDAGQDLHGLAHDGETLWAITREGQVVRLDPATGSALESFNDVAGVLRIFAIAPAGNGELFALGVDFQSSGLPTATILRLRP